MFAQALEANGAIVYILGRRQEMLEQAAATAVRGLFCSDRDSDLTYATEAWQYPHL
jgi:NADP-dependent 3-hydroxy acid dehydrogenase YdfG